MISLVYFSSAAPGFSRADLSSILEASQRNNAGAQVTGLLCYLDGSFVQFLEGEPDNVAATYERIARDPRHRQILKVHEAAVSTRAFETWSMGLVEADRPDAGHSAFARNLRRIEISEGAEHREVLAGFLDAFRAWIR